MAVRLRPQSASWLAPTALAAQLTAQTGQIAGQGVASLLGGIASGVGAYTQKREQRRAEAINESRYQDSLGMRRADDARQDRAFKYGAAQDQMALAQRYAQGLEVKAQNELATKGTVDPATAAEIQKLTASMKALGAQGAQIGGVQAAEIPDVDYSKMVASLPTGATEYSREDAVNQAKSMRNMTDEELDGILGFYTQNATEARAALNSKKVEGADLYRLRTDAGNYEMLRMLAENEAKRRGEVRKQTADNEKSVREVNEKKVKDEAAIASLQESLKKEGSNLVLPTGDLESARARYNDETIKLPIRKEKAAQFEARRTDAAARFDRVMADRERKTAAQESRAAKGGKAPPDPREGLFKKHLAMAKAASDRYDFDTAKIESDKADLLLDAMEADSPQDGTPTASSYPSWLPSDPAAKAEWDALSPDAKKKVIDKRGR